MLLTWTVKRRLSQRCRLPRNVVPHTKKWEPETKGTKRMQHELWDTLLLRCQFAVAIKCFYICCSVPKGEAGSPLPYQNRKGMRNCLMTALQEKEKEERDHLITVPYRPPILPYPGRLTRHSAKLRLAVGQAFIFLCRLHEYVKVIRALWWSHCQQ